MRQVILAWWHPRDLGTEATLQNWDTPADLLLLSF